jgi:hypothetical protein
MPASGSGCEHPYRDGARASAWSQAERDHTIVAQRPDLSFLVPRPTGLLYQLPERHVGEGDL